MLNEGLAPESITFLFTVRVHIPSFVHLPMVLAPRFPSRLILLLEKGCTLSISGGGRLYRREQMSERAIIALGAHDLGMALDIFWAGEREL